MKVANIEWIVEKHVRVFAHHENLTLAVSEWRKDAIPRFNKAQFTSTMQSLACLYLFHTADRAHCGMACLCEEGLATEALALARKLFEAYVNAKYIRLNPETNAPLLVYHPVVTDVVRTERLWRLRGRPMAEPHYEGAAGTPHAQDVDKLLADIAELLQKPRCDFSDLERLARNWSGVSMIDMCKAIDRDPTKAGVSGPLFENIYDGYFRDLCEYSHGTGRNTAQGITPAESTIETDFRRTDINVPNAMIIGSKLYIWFLLDLAQVIAGSDGQSLYSKVVEPFLAENRTLAHEYNITMEIA